MNKLHIIGETGIALINILNTQLQGIYNIIDYGAVSGGAAAQVNIQAAIDDAVTGTYGATVIIPAGIWNITGAVILKSWVSIEIQNGATFIFPSGYAGSMWTAPATNLNNCKVRGGNYIGVTPTWNLIDLISTNNEQHVVFCSFSNMYAQNVNKAIKLTSNNGWINASTFKNITLEYPITGIEITEDDTSFGVDGNYFSNIQYQCSASSLFGIHFDGGVSNHVNNLVIWDVISGGETISTCTLTLKASKNYIIGVAVKDKNFVDDGTLNTVISN